MSETTFLGGPAGKINELWHSELQINLGNSSLYG